MLAVMLFSYSLLGIINQFFLELYLVIVYSDKYNNRMGAACEKQFSNIPAEFPSEYEQERERISTSSIKLQHKNFRPNSKNVTIGMIDTIMESQISKNLNRTGNFTSPNKTKIFTTYSPEKFKPMAAGRELDLQQLHATQRPFEGAQTITLGIPEALIPKQHEKNRQLLDFTFYHSLGLEEYNYRPFPPEVANDFQNLPVCEQEIRNGVKYIGEWKNDLKAAHGNGVMQSNTTKYIGQFRNGLKHFHGRQIQKSQVYEGQFEDGRRKGQGSRYFIGGSEEGTFDQYLTKGKVTYENESTYEGELMQNKYHGEGTFINKKAGITQSGTYRNGKLHGKGRIERQGAVIYEGGFEQDLKHGKGAYYWNRQNYYKGNYAKDKKHGYGELRKGDLIYRGMFKNGNMDGPIEVFEIVDGRQFKKPTINFQNGIREYDDEEPSTFSDDGLPRQWRMAVARKQKEQSSKLDNNSFSLNSQSAVMMHYQNKDSILK